MKVPRPVGDTTTGETHRPNLGPSGPIQPHDAPVNPVAPPSVAFLRTLVMTSITWPRRLGRPVGPLTRAFGVKVFSHQRIADAFEKHVAIATIPIGFDLSEGPHDDLNWRLTVTTTWVEPSGWGSVQFELDQKLKADIRSHTNTIEVGIADAWEAVPGLRAPMMMPIMQVYEHPKAGPMTLQSFQVWRLGA